MKLPAEDLLAALVAAPAGLALRAASAAAGGGAQLELARAELQRRGHSLAAGDWGLRLQCAREHFDPAGFRRAQHGRLGAMLEVWERAPSSNDLAHAGAAAGAPDGAVWLVEEQSLGRGRQGRSWQCPAHAGLLFSFLLRDALVPGSRPTLLPLTVGLGVYEALSAATGLAVRTKWPNDVWIGGRKVAGILVEARAGDYAVVGIGMNVAPAAPDPGLPHATTLAAHGVAVRREALCAALLAGVEARLADWRAGRFDALLAAWTAADLVPGRVVDVECGRERLAGRAVAVSGDGLLQVDLDGGGRREFAAGEVHLR